MNPISSPLLEVCADSLASALAAVRGGAQRIELCSALAVGGLTPSPALFSRLREETALPVNCMIRPRCGDFLYSAEELLQMRREILLLRGCGADGFVFGCLAPDGTLDAEALHPLLDAAAGCRVTLHRAFDLTRDAHEALATAAALGFDTVLTSGQQSTCLAGADCLASLFRQNAGVSLLLGSGVNAEVIRTLAAKMPARQFHLSGKREIESGMVFRRPGVPMGLPGLSEYTLQRTDEAAVRAAAKALREICGEA